MPRGEMFGDGFECLCVWCSGEPSTTTATGQHTPYEAKREGRVSATRTRAAGCCSVPSRVFSRSAMTASDRRIFTILGGDWSERHTQQSKEQWGEAGTAGIG